jgi:septal ring factor EnvC (AmiA/AmiB activator)
MGHSIAHKIFTTLAAIAFCTQIAAANDGPIKAAQLASSKLREAAEQLKIADTAKDRVAALSKSVRTYEEALLALRDSLRAATIRERVIRLDFESRRDQLSQLLGVLQTMERATTPLLLIHPTGPVGTARSGMMMSEVTPALHKQAETLRLQLEELAKLQNLQKSVEDDLKWGLGGVQSARIELTQAVSGRVDLPKRYVDDPIKLQIMADNAETLDRFADVLIATPLDGLSSDPIAFETAQGSLPLPVAGTLLHGFNEVDAAGLERPGIVLSARALSLVSTPWPATIRYSGPFLDYGNVIILEPDAGYLVVLAGLDQVYGEFGEILDAGDPIGLLGGASEETEEFLIEASQGGGNLSQETLYIELRENGIPTDPTAWFDMGER